MKSITKFLLASTCVIMATTSFADNATLSSPNQGFYLGADAGFGSSTCSACSANINLLTNTYVRNSTSHLGLAANIFGGYQFNPYLALEAGWGALPEMTVSLSGSDASSSETASTSVTASHFYAAVKGMLPLQNQFGLFAKVGYDAMSVGSSSNVLVNLTTAQVSFSNPSMSPAGVFFAVGGSYNLKENVAATLSYNQIIDSASVNNMTQNVNVGYATVGLTYLF